MCIVIHVLQWLLVYQTKHTGQTTPSFAYLCATEQESEQEFKNVGWRADIFSSMALVMKYHAREYDTDLCLLWLGFKVNCSLLIELFAVLKHPLFKNSK